MSDAPMHPGPGREPVAIRVRPYGEAARWALDNGLPQLAPAAREAALRVLVEHSITVVQDLERLLAEARAAAKPLNVSRWTAGGAGSASLREG